jgi:predicted O-methyltransferase YrrM
MAQTPKQTEDRGPEYNEIWDTVDQYTFGHLHSSTKANPTNDVLNATLANSEKEGLRAIAVSASQGKFLQLQARILKAKHILEVGTLGGYSAIWMAHGSPDVKITTIENNEHNAKVARVNIANAGLADRIDVRLGAGVDVLPQLVDDVKQGKHGKFELTFIDADKENNWNYVQFALQMVDPGAVIIVDNVVRKGQVADPTVQEHRVLGARNVIEKVGLDPRLDATVLQTVGDKSYDGFLMAVVN